MPSVIARGQDDLLLDRIASTLAAFSAAQAAIDPSVKFSADRDRKRPARGKELPLVNVWIESEVPGEQSVAASSSQAHSRINIDLVVRGDESPTAASGDPTASDQVAARRLAYLKEQVRFVVFGADARNTLFPDDLITKISWPSYTANPEPSAQAMEQLADGRWTFEVDYAFEVQDTETPVNLAQITATGGDPAVPLFEVTENYP